MIEVTNLITGVWIGIKILDGGQEKMIDVKSFKKTGIGKYQETCCWQCLDGTEVDKLFEESKIFNIYNIKYDSSDYEVLVP